MIMFMKRGNQPPRAEHPGILVTGFNTYLSAHDISPDGLQKGLAVLRLFSEFGMETSLET